MLELEVTEDGRLDRWVVGLRDVGSRSRAKRVIGEGKVTVDGEVVRDPGTTVSAGSVVAIDWNRKGTGSAKVSSQRGLKEAGLVVLYEDERLLGDRARCVDSVRTKPGMDRG